MANDSAIKATDLDMLADYAFAAYVKHVQTRPGDFQGGFKKAVRRIVWLLDLEGRLKVPSKDMQAKNRDRSIE